MPRPDCKPQTDLYGFRHNERLISPLINCKVPLYIQPSENLFRGALLIMAAELMFASMGASIRAISSDLNNPVIVFVRNLVGVMVIMPWLLRGGIKGFQTAIPHWHLLRGLAGVGAMYCFFYAIAHMPLADAMLLKLTAPLFMPFIALAWLGERFTWPLLLALLVGFAGVTIMLTPNLDGQIQPVALVAISGGVLAAIAKVTVRRLRRSEPASRVVFYFALIGLLVSLLPLYWYWLSPTVEQWGWLVLVGLFASAGQILLTRGMGLAPAGHLAPFTFFSVLFGAALGWWFWNETVTLASSAGAFLILFAAVITGRTQHASPTVVAGSQQG